MSASLDALKGDARPGQGASDPPAAGDAAIARPGGTEVDDLISKAALAVEGHADRRGDPRTRMTRLSADAAASLRSAIANETPTDAGQAPRGESRRGPSSTSSAEGTSRTALKFGARETDTESYQEEPRP